MSWKTFKEASTIRTNFHSHTTRCQHATGADEDYVLAAIAAGYSHLGFSDHSPFPYEDGFVSGMRMRIDQYQDYLGSVRELRERYQDQIRIHLGVEAEYYERYQGWLAGQLSSGTLEYLILGSHYDLPEESFYFGEANTPALLRRYAEHTIRGMESGLYRCLAHPELFMISMERFDENCAAASRDICRAAKEQGVLLEYNLSGLYYQSWRTGAGYPTPGFWQIAAREGASAIIGLDAHNPARYADTRVYDQARKDLAALGIRVADSLLPCAGDSDLAV